MPAHTLSARPQEDLPKPEEIEIETQDIYRHDEEQAYVTLMSQQVKSLNFPCEENYTIKLCKEIVAYHYPDEMPLGSFELLASNKVGLRRPCVGQGFRWVVWRPHQRARWTHPPRAQIRSDEETLGEVFNGDPYFTEKEPAEDPDFDWVPRKEQVFSDKMLMQLSIWKKEWDDDKKAYDPIDIGYMPYGYHLVRSPGRHTPRRRLPDRTPRSLAPRRHASGRRWAGWTRRTCCATRVPAATRAVPVFACFAPAGADAIFPAQASLFGRAC